ncbi:MAG: FecR domain-containing protein [Phycisphaeraceae bacterium]
MTSEIEALIHEVLHGRADAQARERLSEWIVADANHARAYARLAMDERAIATSLQRASARSLEALSDSPEDSVAGLLLAELARAEDEAQPALVELIDLKTNWFAEHGRALAWAAGVVLAAGITIALTLTATRSPNNPSPLAIDRSTPNLELATPALVATLTAEQDATWAGGDVTPGSPLRAGTRLTLTQGFAEITTQRGAVAILEAPATIELTHNDNALRLHTGKLVGICETESSKGFIVRTPHMDVTDLGTRFGVDASEATFTELHVFEGEVEAKRNDSDTPAEPQLLVAGQAVRAERSGTALVQTSAQADRFTQRLTTLLAATGQGQAAQEVADNWRVVAVDGVPITEHSALIVKPQSTNPNDAQGASRWLRVNPALQPQGKKSAVFTCQGGFNLSRSTDLQASTITLRCIGDHSIKSVRVNDKPLKVPSNRIGRGWVTLDITQHTRPGENTVEIDIIDYFQAQPGNNEAALRVEVEARNQ